MKSKILFGFLLTVVVSSITLPVLFDFQQALIFESVSRIHTIVSSPISIISYQEVARRVRSIDTIVSPVQVSFNDLVDKLRATIDKPYFVLDVDKTLLPKDVDLSEPGDNYRYKWTLETLRKALKKAKENETMVGIISANSRAYVWNRLIKPLKEYLGNEVSLLEYLAFYADGGGYRILFAQNGEVDSERSGAVTVADISAAHIINQISDIQSEFKKIIADEALLKELRNGLEADGFKREYKELLKNKYKLSDEFAQKIVDNSTWIDGDAKFEMPVLEIEDEEVNEGFLKKKLKDKVAAPWIEVRDKVQLAIKPIKEFEKKSAEKRAILMDALKKNLGIGNVVPGGSTTIDISLLKKKDTLKNLLTFLRDDLHLQVDNSQVVYFGDEFAEKIVGYPGHDAAVAQAIQTETELEGIRVVSVDSKPPMKNIRNTVNWIGNGPGQTLDIVNNVLEKKTIWEARAKINNYLQENARSILVDNSGVINLKDLSRETDIRISELKEILRSETFSGNPYYKYPGIIGSVFGGLLSEDNLAQDPELKVLLQDKIEKALIAQGVPSEELREKVVDIYREKLKKGFREFEFFDVLTDPEALQNLSFGFLKKVVNKDRIKYATTVHLDGDWHVNAHVMVVDKEGRMLVQVKKIYKDGEIQRDLSASGHVSAGENVTEGAEREIMEEVVGLTDFVSQRLIEVGIYKKISGQGTEEGGYQGTATRGVFQGKSSEVYNREVSGLFIYKVDKLKEIGDQVIAVINDREYQLAPGESEKLIVKHLDDLLSDYVTKKSQPNIKIDDFFRGAFRQYFEIPGLIEYIKSKLK